jgi:hypothetical protein
MSPRSEKRSAIEKSRAHEPGEYIQEFLARKLPPGKTTQAPYFTNALLEAGARYDRYTAGRNDWWDYEARKERLERIETYANWLETALHELDIISREDFANRVNPKEIDALVGSLRFVSKEMTGLAKQVQRIGRPRDLAEERWVMELADIYENAFGQAARIGPVKQRGNFHELLYLSRPTSYPRHGKLSARQIDRMLKRRRSRQLGEDPPAPVSRRKPRPMIPNFKWSDLGTLLKSS